MSTSFPLGQKGLSGSGAFEAKYLCWRQGEGIRTRGVADWTEASVKGVYSKYARITPPFGTPKGTLSWSRCGPIVVDKAVECLSIAILVFPPFLR